ncbi:MAG: hypothetical protein ACON4T_09740 [Synechococcus sp.]
MTRPGLLLDGSTTQREHHMEACTVFQGRGFPPVMAAACKALEGAINIEATALGVSGLLEDLSI